MDHLQISNKSFSGFDAVWFFFDELDGIGKFTDSVYRRNPPRDDLMDPDHIFWFDRL